MSGDYPSDWDSRRRKVYERDDYTCQNCGAKGGPHGGAELHAHHVVPKSDGGSDKLSNLQCLCKNCHAAIHGSSKAPTARRYKPTTSDSSEETEGIDVIPFEECLFCGNKESFNGRLTGIFKCQMCGAKYTAMGNDGFLIQKEDSELDGRVLLERDIDKLAEQHSEMSDRVLELRAESSEERWTPSREYFLSEAVSGVVLGIFGFGIIYFIVLEISHILASILSILYLGILYSLAKPTYRAFKWKLTSQTNDVERNTFYQP